MEEVDYKRLSRRMKNLVGPYAKGFIAGLDRAFLNQREFKERHPDLPQHKYCLRNKAAWGDGYKHGFEGQEPQPPRGAPKSGQPTKTHTIRLRVTKSQFKVYNDRGGNEWFLALLEPQPEPEETHESTVAARNKTAAKRKPAAEVVRDTQENEQSSIELVTADDTVDSDDVFNAA